MILLSSHSRSVKSVAGNDDSPGGAGKVKFLWSSFANCRSCCLDLYIKILFVLLEKVKKEIGRGALIQRYKGLGEMNPDQLWDTTLNPETRTLFQVTIEDAAKAEKMVSLLMGDVVEPRKNYMYKYAEF